MDPLTILGSLNLAGRKALIISILVIVLCALVYIFSAEISKGGKRAYEKFNESVFSDPSEYDSFCVPEPGEPCP